MEEIRKDILEQSLESLATKPLPHVTQMQTYWQVIKADSKQKAPNAYQMLFTF